jgi:hypothetical protein
MKSIFKIFVACLFFAAMNASAQTITKNVKTCLDFSQFFKFNGQYPEGQFAEFEPLANFHVKTDMPALHDLKDTVYSTTFTSEKSAVLGGLLYLADSETKNKLLCGISFSCGCSENGCTYEVTTFGPRCSISGDGGSPNDPYVISVDASTR